MRRLAVVLVLGAIMLSACGLGEEPLSGRKSCWPLEADDNFGKTRELDDVDIALFSRPGQYTADEVRSILGPLGVTDDAVHAQRTTGPCGQQDVFLAIGQGEACVTVVGLNWWDRACTGIGEPPHLVLDLGSTDGHAVAWVSLNEASHVRAESGGYVLGAFDMNGVALLTSPEPFGSISEIGFDGEVLRTEG